VLAQDVVSALQVPPNDNSSMDGYAVRCADVRSGRCRVLQVTQAHSSRLDVAWP
jgi:molybdopterin molybdotransferase